MWSLTGRLGEVGGGGLWDEFPAGGRGGIERLWVWMFAAK